MDENFKELNNYNGYIKIYIDVNNIIGLTKSDCKQQIVDLAKKIVVNINQSDNNNFLVKDVETRIL